MALTAADKAWIAKAIAGAGVTSGAKVASAKPKPIIAKAKVAAPEIERLEGESLNDAKRRLGLGGVCDACERRFASESGLDWHLANFTHPAAE